MDRLFRKRAPSRSDGTDQWTSGQQQPSTSDREREVRRAVNPSSTAKALETAPKLEMDFRNSLILPSLSQRFSVLLPSLSQVPESSIRSLLAVQRARQVGPALTVEEENLLLAELRDAAMEFSNPPASSASITPKSPTTTSPSQSSVPTLPPPSSTSISSFHTFQTFGVGETETLKVRSYGFSGGSSLRDGEYLRKTRNEKHRAPPSSIPSQEEPTAQALSLSQPVRHPLFSAFTPAQIKRISMALGEIEGKLVIPSSPGNLAETLLQGDELQEMQPNSKDDLLVSSKLPPSPRSRDLHAKVQAMHQNIATASALGPILTPSRTQPARRPPAGTADKSPVGYIPGQPRPVRLASDVATSVPRSDRVRHMRIGSSPSPALVGGQPPSLSRSLSANEASRSTSYPALRVPEALAEEAVEPTGSLPAAPSNVDKTFSVKCDHTGIDLGPPTTSQANPQHVRSVSDQSDFAGGNADTSWEQALDLSAMRYVSMTESAAAEVLLQHRGLAAKDMFAFQMKLVAKAGMERVALREPSPVLPTTSRISPLNDPRLPSPVTPSHEEVATPRTAERRALGDDPDIRQDFEARIAAATAALNRTPSTGSGLRRKGTKKGPMIISSPTLVSSSATLPSNPVTPNAEIGLDSTNNGSTRKKSIRWRGFGFRRGLSTSSNAAASTTPQPSPLQEPIFLRSNDIPLDSSRCTHQRPSLELDAFRFPKDSSTSALPASSPARTGTTRRGIGNNGPNAQPQVEHRSDSLGENESPEIVGSLEANSTLIPCSVAPDPIRRNVIRRTLLLPTTDQTGSLSVGQTANQSHRTTSVRRKPVNLTPEDQILVSGSPQKRKSSTVSASTILSDLNHPGLGALSSRTPPLGSDEISDIVSTRRSSAGASLYDLYQDEPELLASPNKPMPLRPTTQAVEIREYADGHMVWSLVDALRTEEEDLDTEVSEGLAHSSTGLDSSDEAASGSHDRNQPLQFRHRYREQFRPATKVYYTSAAEVDNLIHSLSQDPTALKGRIDIMPTAVNGQFEDAPSPPTLLAHSAWRGSGATRHVADTSTAAASPTAPSFASSADGVRTVEDRLQALLDKLKASGVRSN